MKNHFRRYGLQVFVPLIVALGLFISSGVADEYWKRVSQLIVTGDAVIHGNLNVNGATIVDGHIEGATPFIFEGATADAYETTLAIDDPTADQAVHMPDASGTILLSPEPAGASNGVRGVSGGFEFEGNTADGYEVSFGAVDPTADQFALLPDASGMVLLSPALTDAANSIKGINNGFEFEGATADGNELQLVAPDVGADAVVTLPAATGTLAALNGANTWTGTNALGTGGSAVSSLLFGSGVVASGNTVTTTTLTGVDNTYNVFASVVNTTTNSSYVVRAVPISGSVVVKVSADPGTSTAVISILAIK